MTLNPRLCVKTADNCDKSYWHCLCYTKKSASLSETSLIHQLPGCSFKKGPLSLGLWKQSGKFALRANGHHERKAVEYSLICIFFFTLNGTEYEHVVSIICFFPFFLLVIKTKEKYFGLLLQTSFNKSPSFQVAVCLSLKASLGAKLLKRKWVWSFGLWMSFCHIPQGQIQHFLKVGAEQEY